MVNQRWRLVVYLSMAIVAVWAVALGGYAIAKRSKVTPEKVNAYVNSIDLAKLSAADRAKAIRELADKLNALSYEDRRRARLDRSALRWFEQMTEEEKSSFIEATMPTGFKQMLTGFEQLSDEKRRKAVDDAVRRLREAQTQMTSLDGGKPLDGTNGPPPLSPELQAKIKAIGLKTFYSQSTAQTKAELAPLLEELQRAMESGRLMRR
jgi:hypothetical protein